MAARKSHAQCTYEEAIATHAFCPGGHDFAQAYPRLIDAWRRCINGEWMGWWIAVHMEKGFKDLYRVLDIKFIIPPSLDLKRSPGERYILAKRIRAHFNSDGTLRKTRKGSRRARSNDTNVHA